MDANSIKSLFEKFSSLTALVVGDVMIDAYLWGHVERISPEAPVPVVHVQRKENRLGGAANVALNLKSLGAQAIICSVVGDGMKGDIFRQTLKSHQFSTEGIIDSTERMTTVKTRVIAGGHHIVRIDEEITSPLNTTDERNLVECIRLVLNQRHVDVVILEDYNKGVLTPHVIHSVIEMAGEKGIPTAVDPKKENFFEFRGCTLFKPNFKELKEGLKSDMEKGDESALRNNIERMEERLGNAISLVTLSELGVAMKKGDTYLRIAAHPREILDVSGAGDTVISVAALALAAGASIETMAYLSNLAGGLVCEKVGVVPPDRNQLLTEAINHL